MSIAVRFVLFTLICGFAVACSDGRKNSAEAPKAAMQVDPHPQAVPNVPLANKPAEPEPAGDAASGAVASVEIKPWSSDATNDSKVIGVIQFAPTSSGMEMSGAMKDLPTGVHGLRIHENGDCSKPGGDFAPTGNLGGLGKVEADASNQAVVSLNVPGLALNGKNSILGHTLVVHEGLGNAGAIIGCGVIAADGNAEVRPENLAEGSAG